MRSRRFFLATNKIALTFDTADLHAVDERSGITRADVIVVLGILILLVSIVVPAAQSAREASRRVQCLGQLMMHAIAVSNYEYAGNAQSLTASLPIGEDGRQLAVGWPILILPQLDHTKLLKQLKTNAVPVSTGRLNGEMEISPADRISLDIFVCPSDYAATSTAGRLSYCANAGFLSRKVFHGDPDHLHHLGILSWDGNDDPDEVEDINVGSATGVFWPAPNSLLRITDRASEGDGGGSTIMFSENLQAGFLVRHRRRPNRLWCAGTDAE
jgi:Protein of unknown function (DUF1559)